MVLSRDTLCVAETTTLSIYCIDGIYYMNGDTSLTINERLQKAIKEHQKDLKNFKKWAKEEKKYNNTYWAERFKRESKYNYIIMTLGEFDQKQREAYLNTPLKEITEQIFDERLDILPPEKYCTIDNITMFCMCEHLTLNYTYQYAWDKNTNKYYSKIVDVSDKTTWVHNLLRSNNQ